MKSRSEKTILERYHAGQCTGQEKTLVKYWAHHLNENALHNLTDADFAQAQEEMWRVIKPKPNYNRFLWQVAAVALVLLSAGIVLFTFLNPAKKVKTNTVFTAIKPGGNHAVLFLSDGKRVVLDDAVSGEVATQSGIKITKSATGLITFTPIVGKISSPNTSPAYNTIQTPAGGQYQINLPDGSHVWLNAKSSLRFPANFQKDARLVELTGEGYFEIAHVQSSEKDNVPFLVRTVSGDGKTGQIVKVLGTHFNINAYPDESAVKTSLLEGSIQISGIKNSIGSKLLKPGEQAVLSNFVLTVSKVDTELAVDWKNGYFRFNDESLESIMRKVARWYNVEVEYEDLKLKKEPFAGVITRFGNVSELLKMLELTGEIKFKVAGRKIYVLNKI